MVSEIEKPTMSLEAFREVVHNFALAAGFAGGGVEDMSAEESGVTPEVFRAYTACLREILDAADRDFPVVKEFLTT